MVEYKECKFFLVEYMILAIVVSATIGNESTICLHRIENSTSTACPSEPQIPSVNGHNRIRIDYINFYKSNSTTGNCSSSCTSGRHAWEVQGKELLKINNFIYQQCSFTQICHLNQPVYTPASLDQTMWFIEIGYTFIDEGELHDFCSSIDKVVNSSLQLVIRSVAHPCFCIVPECAHITVVEYTPCSGVCSKSKVYFNGYQYFDCGTQCNFTTYNNVRMNLSNTETNITVENISPVMLFWISVTVDNSDTNIRVKCNTNMSDVVQTPTSTLSQCTETITTESNNVGTTVTRDVVVTSNTDIPTTTSDELDTGQRPQAQTFPVSAVVGGVVGSAVAVVIIISVIMLMREARARNEASETSNQYNEVVFQPETQSKSRGVTNEAYGETIDIKFTDDKLNDGFNRVDTANEQGGDNFAKTLQGTDNEYAILTNVDKRITGGIYSKIDKLGQTYQDTDTYEVNAAYAEPYTPRDEVDYTMYGGTGQQPAKVSAYDTFAESDEYSHIHADRKYPILPNSDNYSHMPLPSGDAKKKVTVNAGQGMDTYNHITVNTENLTAGTNSSNERNDFNVENVEYDSCASF